MDTNEPTQQMWEASGKANEQVAIAVASLRVRLYQVLSQETKGYLAVDEFANLVSEVASDLQSQAAIWENTYKEAVDA